MTAGSETFSDETLRAYLAGDLDAGTAERIESQIETDPDLETRLMQNEPLAPMLKTAFGAIPATARLDTLNKAIEALDTQIAQSVPADPAPRRALRSGWLQIAAVLVAGVFGFALSELRPAPDPAPMGWRMQVAVYQALYAPETLAAIEEKDAELTEQLNRASATLGRPLDRSTLETLDGYTLKRTQILAMNGKPIIQIAFVGPDGAPMALCILRSNKPGPAAPAPETLAGLASAHWSKDGYGFLLIGGDDLGAVESTAQVIAAAL